MTGQGRVSLRVELRLLPETRAALDQIVSREFVSLATATARVLDRALSGGTAETLELWQRAGIGAGSLHDTGDTIDDLGFAAFVNALAAVDLETDDDSD